MCKVNDELMNYCSSISTQMNSFNARKNARVNWKKVTREIHLRSTALSGRRMGAMSAQSAHTHSTSAYCALRSECRTFNNHSKPIRNLCFCNMISLVHLSPSPCSVQRLKIGFDEEMQLLIVALCEQDYGKISPSQETVRAGKAAEQT